MWGGGLDRTQAARWTSATPPPNPINSSALPGRAGWTAWKADTDIDESPPRGEAIGGVK